MAIKFKLRHVAVLVAVVAVALGLLRKWQVELATEARAVEELSSAGVTLYYDFEYADGRTPAEFPRRAIPLRRRILPARVAFLRDDGRTELDVASLACDLPQLRELHLDTDDEGIRKICTKLPRLRWLSLVGPKITDAGVDDIPRLRRLECLAIYNTSITDSGLSFLSDMTRLKRLVLRLQGPMTNEGLVFLKHVTDLESLDLEQEGDTQIRWHTLPRSQRLKRLRLSGMKIGSDTVDWILAAQDLTIVQLERVTIHQDAIRRLTDNPSFEYLEVSDEHNWPIHSSSQ